MQGHQTPLDQLHLDALHTCAPGYDHTYDIVQFLLHTLHGPTVEYELYNIV